MARTRIIFRRVLSGKLTPGMYRRVRTRDGRKLSAIICCPACGYTAHLNHEVDDDGIVTPSIVCPAASCSFHEWGKLDGWAE